MKKPIHLICILFFTFTFSSCENREKQADKLAEQFMLKNLNDPSSYQLVERGPIDSLYSQYRFTDEAQHLVDRMKQIADSAARYSASVSTVPKAQRLIADGQRLLRRYREKQKTSHPASSVSPIPCGFAPATTREPSCAAMLSSGSVPMQIKSPSKTATSTSSPFSPPRFSAKISHAHLNLSAPLCSL